MSLYTYRLTVDSGDAPNPYGGICSLAICKPSIRRTCSVGDWIVGLVSKSLVYNSKSSKEHVDRLLYAMKISHKMTFEEYDIFCKKECNIKLPNNARTGDCIYFKNANKQYKQRLNYAHNLTNMSRDLENGKYVIFAEEFYYFGKNSIEIPKIMEDIIIKGQGHQKYKNKDYIEIFEPWIRTQKQGINGNPYMKMSKTFIKNEKGCNSSCSSREVESKKSNC